MFQKNGGTAVDAVEAAVRFLENDEHFNAGCGSLLNNDCQVECDAMIMEGHTLKNGKNAPCIMATIAFTLKIHSTVTASCNCIKNVNGG